MSENWRSLWEFRGVKYKDKDLRKIDGYDLGKITDKGFNILLKAVINKLDLNPNDAFLDVGCGAGALLYPISTICKNVAGVDYAGSLIEVAKKHIPQGDLHCCEASELPFEDKIFDKILTFSVFHYFPSLEYAKTVIDELVRCTKEEGRILICDVPDNSKKVSYEKIKAEKIKAEAEKEDFSDDILTHLYYKKSFFNIYLQSKELNFEIFDYIIDGYYNSKYRFNVLIYP